MTRKLRDTIGTPCDTARAVAPPNRPRCRPTGSRSTASTDFRAYCWRNTAPARRASAAGLCRHNIQLVRRRTRWDQELEARPSAYGRKAAGGRVVVWRSTWAPAPYKTLRRRAQRLGGRPRAGDLIVLSSLGGSLRTRPLALGRGLQPRSRSRRAVSPALVNRGNRSMSRSLAPYEERPGKKRDYETRTVCNPDTYLRTPRPFDLLHRTEC